jgi:hypothetical protein
MNRVMFEEEEQQAPLGPPAEAQTPPPSPETSQSVLPQEQIPTPMAPANTTLTPEKAPIPEVPQYDAGLEWAQKQEQEGISFITRMRDYFSNDYDIREHNPELGPKIEAMDADTAARPSESFGEQFEQSFDMMFYGPDSPSGSIRRLSDEISRYSKDVRDKTGIDPLDGLDPDEMARQRLGFFGNLGQTWADTLTPRFLKNDPGTIDPKAATQEQVMSGLVSDLSLTFEKRLDAINRAKPEAGIKTQRVSELEDKSISDYNNLTKQYEKSNARNEVPAALGTAAGMMAGWLADPINLAVTVISGGSGSVAKAIGLNVAQTAITSAPGYIEGSDQGINDANALNYGLNVAAAGVIGGAAHYIMGALGKGKNWVAEKFHSFENTPDPTPVSVAEAMRSGTEGASKVLTKASETIKNQLDLTPKTPTRERVALEKARDVIEVKAEEIKNNPLGKSTEAVNEYTRVMDDNLQKLLNDEWDFTAPKLRKYSNMTAYKTEKFRGFASPKNQGGYNNLLDRITPDAARIEDNLTELQRISEFPGETYNTARLSTMSGNYIPRINKKGMIDTFDTLDEAMKARDKIGGSTAIGSSPEGKFTIVDDTSARLVATTKTVEQAEQVIKEQIESGRYNLREFSVIKEGAAFRVVANATEEELKRMSDHPGYFKINAARRTLEDFNPTPEARAEHFAELDRNRATMQLKEQQYQYKQREILNSIKERADSDIKSLEKYIESNLEKDLLNLPDKFEHTDSVWGKFDKSNMGERIRNIRQAVKEFIDCAGA